MQFMHSLMQDIQLTGAARGLSPLAPGQEWTGEPSPCPPMSTCPSPWTGEPSPCPFRAAQQLGTKGKWPKSRYIAKYDPEKCRLCGRCVQRCHFGAFYHDGTSQERRGKEKKNVAFNSDLCWGCGLCANTCPDKAIAMEKL